MVVTRSVLHRTEVLDEAVEELGELLAVVGRPTGEDIGHVPVLDLGDASSDRQQFARLLDRFVEDLRSVQYRPTDPSNHSRRSA